MGIRLNTTPLNDWHKAEGANMADFGGFDMPLWYTTGVKTEHLSVLTAAGMFDTSHMCSIRVSGEDAQALINDLFTRDIGQLQSGRCAYGAFLNPDGTCIDDAIVYKFSDTDFMICVNAGMGHTISDHLMAHCGEKKTGIRDLTGQLAKMDVQGPLSAKLLSKVLLSPETVFHNMPYFSFKGDYDPDVSHSSPPVLLEDRTPVLLSRSGYTGEFGFELFLSPDAIVKLWTTLWSIGRAEGLTACGLAARDSLRVGACLPLSHQDIGPWKFIRHPWEFALPYARREHQDKDGGKQKFTKPFLGAEALVPDETDFYTIPFVGDNLKKISAGEDAHVLDRNGRVIGSVLTCATDMGITWHDHKIVSINTGGLPPDLKIKGLACGFVRVSESLDPGTVLTLRDNRREIRATLVADIRPDRTARKKIHQFI